MVRKLLSGLRTGCFPTEDQTRIALITKQDRSHSFTRDVSIWKGNTVNDYRIVMAAVVVRNKIIFCGL